MRAPARAEPKPKAVPPCFRYDYDPVFIPACVQAMYEGTATAHQQRALLDWIVGEAAATYQPAHVPGDSHSSAFLAGRAFLPRASIFSSSPAGSRPFRLWLYPLPSARRALA